MAHIWQFQEAKWSRRPLVGDYFCLVADEAKPVRPAPALPTSGLAALGCYRRPDQPAQWVLLGSVVEGVRVNGHALPAGLAVLRDRDEILLGRRTRLYFSTEELAQVEPFPGGGPAIFCARCRQAIAPGTPAVRCPACGHWCEHSETKPCWTYGPTCPLCEQPTAFDTGLRWTPEEL